MRKDSAAAHLITMRLMLSIAVCLSLRLAKIDIKAACFQSGPIKRRIYARPPRELCLWKAIWKLLSLPHGIAEAGRQWQLVSDDFLNSIGLEQARESPQRFILRKKGKLALIIGKAVDDFLIAGAPEALEWLSKKASKRFKAGAEERAPKQIRFNGARIDQAKDCPIRAPMEDSAKTISRLDINRS